jgi:sulfotransferase
VHTGLHFISGLPRSGSALLAALLRQNPDVHAGITSPIGSLISMLLREMSQGNESAIFIDDTQRKAILRGVFDGYYGAISQTQTVFDTNRLWCAKLNVVAALFPNAKVVCCVRHLPWVLDSIERLTQQNRWELSKIFNFDPGGTVYSRVEGLVSSSGLVGFAYNALKQAMHSEESDRLLLVSYETLTREPQRALDAIYDFTGLPPFQHDFESVTLDANEFDARLGTPGLHKVGNAVRPNERQSILPPDLWRRFEVDSFWSEPAWNLRGVRIV